LIDENLSRRLVSLLLENFPGSMHVSAVNMLRTPDPEIWEYAKANDFTIITKDDDFLAIAQRNGPRPKSSSSSRAIARTRSSPSAYETLR
jgi:predicted nuclease of predicted toxin-antitoxin system